MQMFAYVHTKSYKLSLEEKNISDNVGCSAVQSCFIIRSFMSLPSWRQQEALSLLVLANSAMGLLFN